MTTFLVTTTADTERSDLTYKVTVPSGSIEPERYLQKGTRIDIDPETAKALGVVAKTDRASGNTSVARIGDDGTVSVKVYQCTWAQVLTFLSAADEIRSNESKPGRPDKNVLQMTTSKERRLGTTKPQQVAVY